MTESLPYHPRIAERFRGYLPVVVDVETGGFNSTTDALLEIAAIPLWQDDTGKLLPAAQYCEQVIPFVGARLDPESLRFNQIQPDNPLRQAIDEKEALTRIFRPIRQAIKASGCKRAILVGHNAAFDLGFINAAVARTGSKRNPFHPFSTLDTVSLGALMYGQTVLARASKMAGLTWDARQAHGAQYDASQTAHLFCHIVNTWQHQAGSSNQQTPPDTLTNQTGS
jgi:ribonuclease T